MRDQWDWRNLFTGEGEPPDHVFDSEADAVALIERQGLSGVLVGPDETVRYYTGVQRV
jgi:hypothetical protein